MRKWTKKEEIHSDKYIKIISTNYKHKECLIAFLCAFLSNFPRVSNFFAHFKIAFGGSENKRHPTEKTVECLL